MTEIISNFFGRPRNDAPDAPVTTHGVVVTDVIENPPADHESDAKEQVEGEASEEIAGELDDQETAQDEAEAVAEDAEESGEAEAADETEESDEVEAADDTDVSDEADESEESEESEEAGASDETDVSEEAEASDEADVSDEADEADEAEASDETEESDEPTAVEADEAEETEEDDTEPARPAAGTRGTVTVDHGVVAKVVTLVAAKIDGVHSLAAEGISVDVDGDVATIKVELVIEFGHAVRALAEQVRTDVIEAVEQFLNFDVAAVDVHVSDIHLPNA